MVPEEIRSALESLIGDTARYVIVLFFIVSVLLVQFRNIRELWLEFLPRRRRDREAQQRMDFAQKLCAIQEKQAALGLDFIDVEEAWRARFPAPPPDPVAVEAPRAVRSRRKLIGYALFPWLFACVYCLIVGGVMIAVVEEIGPEAELAVTDAASYAIVVLPFLLTVFGLYGPARETWDKGYFAVMGGALVRILWGGFLYMPLLTGLFYLLGFRA